MRWEGKTVARMGEGKTTRIAVDSRRCPEHGGRVQELRDAYTGALQGESYRCCGKRVTP